MNKYQDALDYLNKCIVGKHGKACLSIVKELVDKETPMKPKKDASNHYYCGKCLDYITFDPNIYLNRCGSVDCGQVVDWSEEE